MKGTLNLKQHGTLCKGKYMVHEEGKKLQQVSSQGTWGPAPFCDSCCIMQGALILFLAGD